MANRIAIPVLGATAAPYSSSNAPALVNGGVSEIWHLDVSQLQRGIDTTPAQQALYPAALSSVVVKFVSANHFNTASIFVNLTATQLDNLANA